MAAPHRLWHFAPMTQDLDQTLPLAAEFPPTSEADWRKLVDAALKGATFEKRLVSQTYDGLRIDPLYPRAAAATPVAGRAPGAAWTVMQRVDHPDPKAANAQALQDLENGATGLTLVMAGSINANGYGLDASPVTLARVFEGIELDAGITIDFNLSPPTRNVVQTFAALVKNRKISPASVELRASINPVGGFAASGTSPMPWAKLSRGFAGVVSELASQGFRGGFAAADGRIVHNAGGSEAQELAFALASAVEYLRALEAGGITPDAARGMIYFRLSADADEFLTIAKFRALRKLWARVEQACGLTPKPAYVAAETAWRMMTQRDPYVNMLRIDGRDRRGRIRRRRQHRRFAAHSRARPARCLRAPHRAQHAAHSAGRIQSVPRRRSGRRLRRHRGPDEQIVRRRLGAIPGDREGRRRLGRARNAGSSRRTSRPCAPNAQKAIARRKDALTGTSDFPNLQEAPAAVLDVAQVAAPKESAAAVTAEPLPRIRLAEPFEALRDTSDAILKKTGARPKVFLANLGKLSEFTARAMFAKNFYEAGGIEAVGNDGFKDRAE